MELEQALAVFGTEFARTAPDDRVTLYKNESSRTSRRPPYQTQDNLITAQ